MTWLPLNFKNLVLNSFKMSKAYAVGLLYISTTHHLLPLYFKNLVLNSFKMSKDYALGLLYNSFGVEPPPLIYK